MERTVFTIEDSQQTDTQNLYSNYPRKLHSPWLLGALLKPLLTDKKQIINLIPDRNFVKKINSHRTHMKMHKTTTWFIVYTYILWQKILAESDWDNNNLLLCLRKGQKIKGRKNSGILRWSITSNMRIMTSLLVLGTQLQAGRRKRWSPCVTWHTAHSIIRFF